MKRTSRELKRIARDLLNNRYTVPMGAFVAACLIPTLIEIPFSMSLGDYPATSQLIITWVADFLILLIAQVLSTGSSLVHLNMTRGKTYGISQIFAPFKSGAERYFGAALLFFSLTLLTLAPAAGGGIYFYRTKLSGLSAAVLALSVLLSLLFFIMLLLYYRLAFLFLLDYPQMKVTAAFKESRHLMKGNKKRLFRILCSFLGWGALILFSFGIAALWVSPYMTQTLIIFYLDCTGELDRIPVRDYGKETGAFPNTIF